MSEGFEYEDDGDGIGSASANAGDISEAEKVEFLHFIRLGHDAAEAARAAGYKPRLFRALKSPQSPFYDEDFAKAYGEATSSFEFATNRLERLREEAFRRGMNDSDRLLEKLLMVHDPDWAVLRQKDTNVNVHVLIQQQLKQLPTERLELLIGWLEEGHDEHEVLEGTVRELPAPVDEAA